MPKNVYLFSLQTFSTTGGIQKMTRTLAHSLNQISLKHNWGFKLWSMYDKDSDLMPQYIALANFKGFSGKRISFLLNSIKIARKTDLVILSHINMALMGLAIKLINPRCKVWLIAHGIEVWRPLSFIKNRFLNACDKVICVSNFTKQEIIKLHQINRDKCEVLNNALDPFMTIPTEFDKPKYLMDRYQLSANDTILFTLTRLNSAEQYKGYEQVIKLIPRLKGKHPNLKYILAGQYDSEEETRIKQLIADHLVEEQVILTGFINEHELSDHFTLADLFVLPSKGEGFGIVFIEALACGLPVICGNVDGSIDAIRNGELGKAVNPDDLDELYNAIESYLEAPLTEKTRKHLQTKCIDYFNEENYISKLTLLLNDRTFN